MRCSSCDYVFSGTGICPSCGHDNVGKVKRALALKNRKKDSICYSCGHALRGTKICPSCGFDHREVKTPPVVYVPDPVPAPDPSATPTGTRSVFSTLVTETTGEGISDYNGPWEFEWPLKLYLRLFLLLDLWLLLQAVFRNFDDYIETFTSKDIPGTLKTLLGIDIGVRFAVASFAIVLVVYFFRSAKWAIVLHAIYSAIASFLLLVSAFPYLSLSFFDRGFIGIAIMVLAFFRVYLWIVLVDREKESGTL